MVLPWLSHSKLATPSWTHKFVRTKLKYTTWQNVQFIYHLTGFDRSVSTVHQNLHSVTYSIHKSLETLARRFHSPFERLHYKTSCFKRCLFKYGYLSSRGNVSISFPSFAEFIKWNNRWTFSYIEWHHPTYSAIPVVHFCDFCTRATCFRMNVVKDSGGLCLPH